MVPDQRAAGRRACLLFAGMLRLFVVAVVGEGVPGVDLHQIVDKRHADYAVYFDVRTGIFCEQKSHESKMPRVLCIRFPS